MRTRHPSRVHLLAACALLLSACVVNPIPTPWTDKASTTDNRAAGGGVRQGGDAASEAAADADLGVGAMDDSDADPAAPAADATPTGCVDGAAAADAPTGGGRSADGVAADCGL